MKEIVFIQKEQAADLQPVCNLERCYCGIIISEPIDKRFGLIDGFAS